MSDSEAEPKVTFTPEEGDEPSTRAELWVDGKAVSRLWVIPFTLRVGAARVRMDGIGGVGTSEENRNRGYARRLLAAAVDWMAGREAALTMLYGIPDFYYKFGYATAGPDHLVHLLPPFEGEKLPDGWSVRGFTPDDLPAVQRIYESSAPATVGTAVRPSDGGGPWSRLLKTPDGESGDEACVVLNPSGRVAAYAWKGSGFWYIKHKLSKEYPDALILGEVMAEGPEAADAVLVACRLWAGEESRKSAKEIGRVLLSLPPEGPVANAAQYRLSSFVRNYSPSGDSMARVLNVERLMSALEPELDARWKAAKSDLRGALHVQTEIGEAWLEVKPGGVTVASPGAARESDPVPVRLPQAALARLALGAFPPHDLLARLAPPLDPPANEILAALFPMRHPHMFIPDRF